MSSTTSHIVSELSELYEFSLNIGTSLDTKKNAKAFFSSFAQGKKLKHINSSYNMNDRLSNTI